MGQKDDVRDEGLIVKSHGRDVVKGSTVDQSKSVTAREPLAVLLDLERVHDPGQPAVGENGWAA